MRKANGNTRFLRDLVELASGQVDPTIEPYASLPHVGGENIESVTGRIVGVKTARELGLTSGKYLFEPGGILYSKIRPNLNKVSVLDFAGICSADIYPLRARSEAVCAAYLAHLLRSEAFLAYSEKHSSRTSIPKLNRDSLLAFETPLPPLAEQRRIADVLDRVESLRAKRRAALAQLDSLTQSIFHDLFGDPIKNPRGFPVRPMIELIDPQRPISYGILMPGPDQAKGVKYVRVTDMKNGGIELSGIRRTTEAMSNSFRRSLLKTADLLMSIRGHVGRFAAVPPELDGANITQDTARLAIVGASPVFVRECLRAEGFQRWMAKHTKGVAVRGINLGDVKLMPIILPPRPTQEKFALRVMAVEALKTAQRASLAELDALFASLQHRAFRGEL